ncbi:MAG: 2-ketocyclohexanecarboxyl-CoA hydrolase [Solirubrobacteraceae bacterium]|jgi:naphthoate synthase|nr:2-ketocyclohexanecarboxyl-CoA hydrolase [Solirubrobacteraceae bacterium]
MTLQETGTGDVPAGFEDLTDVAYGIEAGLAWITIDRPERLNAFRARTVDELIRCLKHAWASPDVGVVCLTGAGQRAFCTGGDQKQRAETGDYGPSATGLFEVDTLHRTLRDIPKPVIAAVNGFAIGGGHVLHVLCDLTIAADSATFGQVGPKVGSFDAGFGTGYLARVIGEKRMREIWFLCKQYPADQALEWGLVNKVVPQAELRDEVRRWADQILRLSPTALKVLKQSMNVDTEQFAGTGQMAFSALTLFTDTDEAREGIAAFNEKRPPDFSPYRGQK